MKQLTLLVLLVSAIPAFSQEIPDAAALRKNKVRIMIRSWDGGTTYTLVDKNGFQIKTAYEDSTFKRLESSATVYMNSDNRPDSIVHDGRSVTRYFYNAKGYYTVTSYGTTSDTTWFDAKGKYLSGRDNAGAVAAYQYNAKNQLVKTVVSRANGDKETTTYTYNAAGQMIAQRYVSGDSRNDYTYTYLKNGLVNTKTSSYGGGSKFVSHYDYRYY